MATSSIEPADDVDWDAEEHGGMEQFASEDEPETEEA